MLIDAVLAAEPVLKIADQISDPNWYLTLTDNIMPFIQASSDPVRYCLLLKRNWRVISNDRLWRRHNGS
jgi:hypothetical protein